MNDTANGWECNEQHFLIEEFKSLTDILPNAKAGTIYKYISSNKVMALIGWMDCEEFLIIGNDLDDEYKVITSMDFSNDLAARMNRADNDPHRFLDLWDYSVAIHAQDNGLHWYFWLDPDTSDCAFMFVKEPIRPEGAYTALEWWAKLSGMCDVNAEVIDTPNSINKGIYYKLEIKNEKRWHPSYL